MSLTPIEEVRFALQAIEDSRRVLLCSPRRQLLCELAAADFPLVEVRPSNLLSDDYVVFMDLNGIEADHRAAMQRWRPTFAPSFEPMWDWRRWGRGSSLGRALSPEPPTDIMRMTEEGS